MALQFEDEMPDLGEDEKKAPCADDPITLEPIDAEKVIRIRMGNTRLLKCYNGPALAEWMYQQFEQRRNADFPSFLDPYKNPLTTRQVAEIVRRVIAMLPNSSHVLEYNQMLQHPVFRNAHRPLPFMAPVLAMEENRELDYGRYGEREIAERRQMAYNPYGRQMEEEEEERREREYGGLPYIEPFFLAEQELRAQRARLRRILEIQAQFREGDLVVNIVHARESNSLAVLERHQENMRSLLNTELNGAALGINIPYQAGSANGDALVPRPLSIEDTVQISAQEFRGHFEGFRQQIENYFIRHAPGQNFSLGDDDLQDFSNLCESINHNGYRQIDAVEPFFRFADHYDLVWHGVVSMVWQTLFQSQQELVRRGHEVDYAFFEEMCKWICCMTIMKEIFYIERLVIPADVPRRASILRFAVVQRICSRVRQFNRIPKIFKAEALFQLYDMLCPQITVLDKTLLLGADVPQDCNEATFHDAMWRALRWEPSQIE